MVEHLEMGGKLESIDKNVFDHLQNLQSLSLDLVNFIEILALDENWSEKLFKKKFTFNLYYPSSESYNFPEEDFCLFKDFLPDGSIYGGLISEIKCSCTKMWVLHGQISNYCYNFENHSCNFSNLAKNCNKSMRKKSIVNSIDVFYLSELISFINLTLFPIFCILGMVNNILIVSCFGSPILRAELNKEMFKLILLNSILNFLFCFFYLFHVTNVCISYTGIFCSAIGKSLLVQNYEKYVVEFLGNIVKTSSNIINVFISVNRSKFPELIPVSNIYVNILNCSNDQKSKISRTEDRITKTICINCLLFFALRSIEFSINGINCFAYDKICSNVSQMANLFYLISCSFQIITYISMNKIFRKSATHIYKKINFTLCFKRTKINLLSIHLFIWDELKLFQSNQKKEERNRIGIDIRKVQKCNMLFMQYCMKSMKITVFKKYQKIKSISCRINSNLIYPKCLGFEPISFIPYPLFNTN
ncbi:hypothetical protein BpHYR1_025794 [Brachionus plicatilis]|uniref:Uncharacterized protein n=1 Tax=Brachionus plicatilis TaxID=10195 RepID=A0A3M7PCK1_BRAPC|nr:hypothetical protein BpHYR1_025794 [Brachionus plicatilis]